MADEQDRADRDSERDQERDARRAERAKPAAQRQSEADADRKGALKKIVDFMAKGDYWNASKWGAFTTYADDLRGVPGYEEAEQAFQGTRGRGMTNDQIRDALNKPYVARRAKAAEDGKRWEQIAKDIETFGKPRYTQRDDGMIFDASTGLKHSPLSGSLPAGALDYIGKNAKQAYDALPADTRKQAEDAAKAKGIKAPTPQEAYDALPDATRADIEGRTGAATPPVAASKTTQTVPPVAPPVAGPATRQAGYEAPRMVLPKNVNTRGRASDIFGAYTGAGQAAALPPVVGDDSMISGGGGGFVRTMETPPAANGSTGRTRYNLMSTGTTGATPPVAPADTGQGGAPAPGERPEAEGVPITVTTPPRPDTPPVKEQVDARGNPKPPAGPGYDYRITYNSEGHPIWQPYSLDKPNQGRDPSSIAAEQERLRIENERLGMDKTLLPYEIDKILAGIGLTTAQADEIKALLPGKIGLQGATIDQIRSEILIAGKRLNLDVDKFDWDKAYQTAGLTGQLGDQATLDRIKTMGFDAAGTPTLDTRRFQLEKDLGYAGSTRADTALNLQRDQVAGYLENTGSGQATLAREQFVSDAERANLVAQANIGNQAAQIRLAELGLDENGRQFDASFGLQNDIQRGGLELQQAQFEAQRRADPSGWVDKAYAARGQQQPQYGDVPPVQDERMSAQVQPGRQYAAPAGKMGFASTAGAPNTAVNNRYIPPTADETPSAPGQMNEGLVRELLRAQVPPVASQGEKVSAQARPGSQRVQAALNAAPLSYAESKAALGGSVSAALEGRAVPPVQTAGGVPMLSAQAKNRLSASERGIRESVLKATGNNPQDIDEQERRLSATGSAGGGTLRPVRRRTYA